MNKYRFHLTFERRQTIEVEAPTLEEARNIVDAGDFSDAEITATEDDYVELSNGKLIE